MAVDAADDEIELGQRVVGEVQRAVAQDVALDAGEDADAETRRRVELAHAPREGDGARFVEAVGHRERLGVVGDRDVLVAALARGRRPSLRASRGRRSRSCACGGRRGCGCSSTSSGRRPSSGGFDLAAVLAQLGRNPRQAERLVDAGLGLAGDFDFVLDAEQAVFAELQPHADGARADGDVVVLAAGEVLHRRAEALRRQRAHVHLKALEPDARAGLVFAAGRAPPGRAGYATKRSSAAVGARDR